MAILKILFRRGSSCRLRMMAMLNIFACCFVVVMTLLTSFLGYFIIVPQIYKNDDTMIKIHRYAITYLFINVCGNFVLCVSTDTSTQKRTGATSTPQRRLPSRTSSSKESTPRTSYGNGPNRNSSESKNSNAAQKTSTVSHTSNARSAPSDKDRLKSSSSSCSKPSISSPNTGVSKQPEANQNSQGNKTLTNSSPNDTDTVTQKSTPKSEPQRTASSKSGNERSKKSETIKSSSTGEENTESGDNPLRSHECKLCEKRILRRDHHCFFMTVCIGYFNHKHFIFFCLYMMIGALYGVILSARFLHVLYKVRFHGPQTFLFLLLQFIDNVVLRKMLPTPFFCLLLFELYVCLAVGLTAAGFLYWHISITVNGQTTHEASHGDTRFRRRRLTQNLRDVFGYFWPLLFLLPLPLPQAEDGRTYHLPTPRARRKPGHADRHSSAAVKRNTHGDVQEETGASKCEGGDDGGDDSDVRSGKLDEACVVGKTDVRERRRKGNDKLGKGKARKTW